MKKFMGGLSNFLKSVTSSDTSSNSSGSQNSSFDPLDGRPAVSASNPNLAERFWVSFEGNRLTPPLMISDIENLGWNVDFETLGEYRTVDPYDDTSVIFKSQNAYDQSFRFYVKATNTGDSDKDVTQCPINGFTFVLTDTVVAGKNIPSVQLYKGITFGNSKQEIENAFGKPENTLTIDSGNSIIYTYPINWSNVIQFTIHQQNGVTKIELLHTLPEA